MNEYEKQVIDEKFDTICNQMIRLHEENMELRERLEKLENKIEAQQKARAKLLKVVKNITHQFLKPFNIQLPLLNYTDSEIPTIDMHVFENLNNENLKLE